MLITLEIPDELAGILAASGRDAARVALEAIGIEAYRQRRISGYQLRTMLDIPTRYEFDGFLKENRIETYTAEDFEHDLATLRHIEEMRKAEHRT